ncbi:MAG: hypothetical protein ACI4VN_03235 [Clostridia bacterium]
MKERKKFILAIPTILIIIVAIIGISLIYYNRNVKKMTRDDIKLLSQKVATIDNISCEVITSNSTDNNNQSVEDYKLKDGIMLSRADDFIIYDNKNEQTLMQIDEEEELVYTYSEYNSEIDAFMKRLLTVESLLENEENEYIFKNYTTMNGIKCVNFEIKNTDTVFEIWLDRKTGMIVRMDTRYGDGESSVNVSAVYRYQINNVTDEDVDRPNTDSYVVIEL